MRARLLQFPVPRPEPQDRGAAVMQHLTRLCELCADNNPKDNAESKIIAEAVYRIANITKKWILKQPLTGGAR